MFSPLYSRSDIVEYFMSSSMKEILNISFVNTEAVNELQLYLLVPTSSIYFMFYTSGINFRAFTLWSIFFFLLLAQNAL